ncbi:putative glycosidase crf1 [Fusarium oxysporum f. sp. cubense]|uniref:Crh-like protein n=1 Tax=Fusarium oxysporum f. sp. cubense TaxID=61366 RepID=A0A559LEC6_FUSOC|nr:putative glycosidase crf1 [Fusarium oxysporum f. sp. cubense]
MFSKAFTTAAMALACAGMVSAQTFTDCNPLKKTCPADPAFGDNEVDCDLAKGACDAFHGMIGTELKYSDRGALFRINKESDAPTIRSNNYLFFGRVDVVVQAAKGQGIVTSAVLQSDDLDEVDWEWVGGDDAQVQSNYFSKGDTTTYDRAQYHPVAAPLTTTHKYSIEWTSTKIDWLIDDAVVRTLNAADAQGVNGFPQTPMQVKLGTWVAGGKNSNEGTREWAGGYTDFDDAPFDAYYRSVTIIDYAGKDAPGQNKGAKQYVYTDKTGDWTSIKVEKTSSDDDKTSTSTTVSKVSKTTKTAEPTKTKTAEATTSAVETTSAHESKTKSAEKESKTESAKEAKTSEVATTFATATSTKAEATATATEGSGSSSGSGSESDAGAGAATATGSGASPSEPATTPVPVNSGSRMAGSVVAAFAGLMVAQILI